MSRRMVINAVHPEEIRIAITEDDALLELEIESDLGRKLKGNVYKAKISRIEPSLQAAFLDIGTQRNGFLQINDVHPAYFRDSGNGREHGRYRARIQDVLEAGQELVVQVVKEERDLKGATLTTYLSLPGRYMVVMPGSERGGISRKINDAEQRNRLRKLARELEMPAGIGMIIRTAGLDRSLAELSRDLSIQLKLWERIITEAQTASCPSILFKESDLAIRVIRDYFTPDVRDIVIDEPETFKRVRNFVDEVMPRYRSRVISYQGKQPIFSHFRIEDQVAGALKREVKLRSGGSLVIDTLEALVAIDVNSGKATTEGSIEETAYKTNLEAAQEIARQLRLRDLGGLIVVDFIDMIERRHKHQLEKRIRDVLKLDKARIEIGRLSKFGLLEMSRQRLRSPLSSVSHVNCGVCQGAGKLRNPELVALEALRKMQSAIIVGNLASAKVRLNPAAALFLLNNKKGELYQLENEFGMRIYVLADGRLRSEEYEFEFEPRKDKPQVHAVSPTPAEIPSVGNSANGQENEISKDEPQSAESEAAGEADL